MAKKKKKKASSSYEYSTPKLELDEIEKKDFIGNIDIDALVREQYKEKYFRAKKRDELQLRDLSPTRRPILREKSLSEIEDDGLTDGIPRDYRCTFTINIDEFRKNLDILKLNPKSFFIRLFKSIQENIPHQKTYRIKYNDNIPISVQQPIHKDEDTVYVQVNGELFEFSDCYSFFYDIIDLKSNRKIMEKAVEIVERNLKWVKQELENIKRVNEIDEELTNENTRAAIREYFKKKREEKEKK